MTSGGDSGETLNGERRRLTAFSHGCWLLYVLLDFLGFFSRAVCILWLTRERKRKKRRGVIRIRVTSEHTQVKYSNALK